MEKNPKQRNECITNHVIALTFTTTQEQPTTLRALPSESILQSCIHHRQTTNIYKIAEKSPPQQKFEGKYCKDCSHNLMRVTHKMSDRHHLHHK
jgi:hypothetical protein